MRVTIRVALVLLSTTHTLVGNARSNEIDFNRDVRPILSDNCFACHGFDAGSREADLRLDTREDAIANRGGYAAIVPQKLNESELWQRINSKDESLVMPPADSHKPRLNAKQLDVLRRWIEQGAPWGKHWSFVPPQRPAIPANLQTAKLHPIDYFVRRKLSEHGLTESAQAEWPTLAKRLAFDLTGLPPTPAQTTGVTNQDQLKELIDALLASPHYGERMAMWWLDGARYSDTDGYQGDATRTNWPWRDWVVESFNRNVPFDEFTIEQFAGDLLPDATDEQLLATCFHRNHMNNGEGGRDAEESRIDYVLDRVNTTGTLWLGLTLGCAQCHDHKFDPVSQADYYRLNAYFNSIDETGEAGGKAGPYLAIKSPHAGSNLAEAQRVAKNSDEQLEQATKAAQHEFKQWLADAMSSAANFVPWHPITPSKIDTVDGYALHQDDNHVVVSKPSHLPQDDFVLTVPQLGVERLTAIRLEVFPHEEHTDGKYSYAPSGEFILTNFKLRVRTLTSTQYREIECVSAIADVEGKGVDAKYASVRGTLDDDPRTGWTTRTKPSDTKHTAVFVLADPLVLGDDEALEVLLMQRSLAPRELMGRFRLSATDQRGPAVKSLDRMPMQRLAQAMREHAQAEETAGQELPIASIDAELRKQLFEQFLEDHAAWQEVKTRNRKIHQQLAEAKKATGEIRVTVLKEREQPRATHILERGVWDQKGAEVERSLLAFLSADIDAPSRLELGQWIVSRENPLTARVIVNQIWQLFFGQGLVRTPNDFGQQGELPTHPELLDWLAVEFMHSGWDVKQLVRTIVTSETYQQSSVVTEALRTQDPHNVWLARGARFRLPAWMIRDSLLANSGLINRRLGGPPVFPYQPDGVWRDQFMGRFTYQPTLGEGQYRRTLYAFWRRSSTPTFLFDSAARRVCEVTPRRTNTPLHALTLMNDLTSLEAARALAEGVDSEASLEAQLVQIFARVVGRQPAADEAIVLNAAFSKGLQLFRDDPARARRFVSVGQLAKPSGDLPQLAAKMLVANLVFNLDEALTHE